MNQLHPGPPADAPAPAARLAAFAAALADETRASICMTLLEGRAWTAGELARITGVAPPPSPATWPGCSMPGSA